MQQVAMENFMSPEHAREQLQHRLEVTANRMRHFACANAEIVITPASIDEKTKTVHPGDIQYNKDKCQNDRRNGSKFCQKCSDEYHARSS